MIKKNGKVYCDICGSKIANCIYYTAVNSIMYHFCDAVCSTGWYEKNGELLEWTENGWVKK